MSAQALDLQFATTFRMFVIVLVTKCDHAIIFCDVSMKITIICRRFFDGSNDQVQVVIFSATPATELPIRRRYAATYKQGTLKGKYHCTVDLLFDWFRNVPLCWVY